MTSADLATISAAESSTTGDNGEGNLRRLWNRVEDWLTRAGDWLNPILVKETRQAIKSRNFTVTGVLVLVACWLVTIGGVGMIGPQIFYSASGPQMFWYYYWILAFPLGVIVPYAAYRSLAAEREDNTYELLSISTLTPRQIIRGKLGSAIVQMLVYVSAVAPCLAFTYLLRGVDVITIFLLISYTILGSISLSMVGILLATSSKERYGQVVLSVVFTVALILVTFAFAIPASRFFIEAGYQRFGGEEFWIINAAMLTLYATTFALLFLGAAAQITFSSDNRSTALRVAMVVQQACFVAWLTFGFFYANGLEQGPGRFGVPVTVPVVVAGIAAAGYWYLMGAMMSAEWPVLSDRVKRALPQSLLGRALFTWFNPGPATGYVFALCNLLAIVLSGLALVWLFPAPSNAIPGPDANDLSRFLVIIASYVVIYLGIGRMVVAGLRRLANVPIVGAVLINGFLVALGSLVPWFIRMFSSNTRFSSGYSYLHLTDVFFTSSNALEGTTVSRMAPLVWGLPLVALLVVVMNLSAIVRELRQVRMAPPPRVLAEDSAGQVEPISQKSSPWDDE